MKIQLKTVYIFLQNLLSLKNKQSMKGAIIGDIIGSRFEKNNVRAKDFDLFTDESRFTDDTVLTVAVAAAIMEGVSYERSIQIFALKYPKAGYGKSFKKWFGMLKTEPYNSWGNGSAMRASAVGYAFNTREKVLEEARKSAEVTHNHPEGIKGAQAIALGVFLAKHGATKTEIKNEIVKTCGYDLDRTLDEIRPTYKFDVSCQGSVPEAIIAFLESTDFEDAIRNAISIGGDSDTIACMAGAIAEAFYKDIPFGMYVESMGRLTEELRDVVKEFYKSIA